MSIQSSELGLNRDSITVLSELGTAVSEQLVHTLTTLEHELSGQFSKSPGKRGHTTDEVTRFLGAVHREREKTAQTLRAQLCRTTLLDCLCAAVLFGHHGPAGFGVENAFTFEMELLASAQTRISEPWSLSPASLRAALPALASARRLQVLHRYAAHFTAWVEAERAAATGPRWQVHHQLVEGSTSLGSAFVTWYDWEYSLRLAEQVRRRGGTHPDVALLTTLYQSIMQHRAVVLSRFIDIIEHADAGLGAILRDGTLLHLPPGVTVSRRAAGILAKYSRKLLVPWPKLLKTVPEDLLAEAEQWRELLVLRPETLGKNLGFARIFRSPLAFSPLVQKDDRVLLALPHTISTNLSQLVERVFASRRDLPYYRARGEAVEQEAIQHLGAVFTDAHILRGGKYRGTRPGELVEVDGVLLWRDVALVVESKGGYLSRRARTGDAIAATGELRRTIGDGFFQAARLLRAIERSGKVTLTDAEARSLSLDARALRRVYVVVPTADTFEPVSTALNLLWQQDIIANRAIPLIISVQQLNLLVDLLPTPLELLGYLDYREEILADPALRVADELEILGGYVGGLDVVDDVGQVRREHGADSVVLSATQQERFIDPWIGEAGTAWRNGLPCRRHPAGTPSTTAA